MKENEMKIIAEIFYKSIKATKEFIEKYGEENLFENQELLKSLKELKKEVLDLCKNFPIYK